MLRKIFEEIKKQFSGPGSFDKWQEEYYKDMTGNIKLFALFFILLSILTLFFTLLNFLISKVSGSSEVLTVIFLSKVIILATDIIMLVIFAIGTVLRFVIIEVRMLRIMSGWCRNCHILKNFYEI